MKSMMVPAIYAISATALAMPSQALAADILQMVCYEDEQQIRVGAERKDRLFVVTQNPGTGVNGSYFVENLYPLEGEEVFSTAKVRVFDGAGQEAKAGRVRIDELTDEMAAKIHEGQLKSSIGQIVVSRGDKYSSDGFALAGNIDQSNDLGANGVGRYREFYLLTNPYWDITCDQPVVLAVPDE